MKHKKIVVGFTYDLAKDYILGPQDPKDKFSEFDNDRIVKSMVHAVEKAGYATKLIGNFASLLQHASEIKKSVDIVFNTAEGLEGRNREAQVPLLLEHYHVPYVGSDALTMALTLDKVITKKILIADHIPTANFISTETRLSSFQILHLHFPLIVKPRWEGSSKGMTGKSKVKNLDQLNEQISYIVKYYCQPALVEEFIAGRECTVALIGNDKNLIAYPPLEITIRGNEVGDKIFVGRYVYSNDVHYECPAKLPRATLNMLTDIAKRTYDAVVCKDLGRVDFRVDANGNPFVLEINPIPALSKQDTFGTIAKSQSISYDELIVKVLEVALKRFGL